MFLRTNYTHSFFGGIVDLTNTLSACRLRSIRTSVPYLVVTAGSVAILYFVHDSEGIHGHVGLRILGFVHRFNDEVPRILTTRQVGDLGVIKNPEGLGVEVGARDIDGLDIQINSLLVI